MLGFDGLYGHFHSEFQWNLEANASGCPTHQQAATQSEHLQPEQMLMNSDDI